MRELTRYHQNPRGLCLPSKATKKQKSTYRKTITIRSTAEPRGGNQVAALSHALDLLRALPILTGFLLRRFGLHLRYRQFAFFELARKMFPYCLGIEIQECTT